MPKSPSRIVMSHLLSAYLISILTSCPNLRLGHAVHAVATRTGFLYDPTVQASLISMYSLHGCLHDTRKLLDEMLEGNTVLWNMAISSFFRSGDCSSACQLFHLMPSPNAVTWSAVIAGFLQNGCPQDSLQTFRKMRREVTCVLNTSNTIATVLSACGRLRDLNFGQQVHAYTLTVTMFADNDTFVGAALVDMYGRCGCMGLARKAFDSLLVKSVVAWSSLIANNVQNKHPLIALGIFKEMVASGAVPNNVTLTTLITACSCIPRLLYGKELHGAVLRRELLEQDMFLSTALISMYCKCGSLVYAYHILKCDGSLSGSSPTPMWNAIISEHVANDRFDDALGMIRYMGQHISNRVLFNTVTFAIVLPICGKSVSLLYGSELHCYALKNELDKDTLVGNGLLDMYFKCGKSNLATYQFDRMPNRSVVSWTMMINGYGMQGNGFGAIKVFEKMIEEGKVEPDHITFVALISACSHSGLVEEGLKYFEVMTQEFCIIPTEENYGCLVDLLARSGHIKEAKNVIKMMSVEPKANIWGAILGACRIHGSVNDAELAAKHLLQLQEKGSGFCKLLSNVYSEIGRLDIAMKLQMEKNERCNVRRQGSSWLKTKYSSTL
ncbi:pentatricopeptide repeat-containing protein At2g13600-like [Typha latifolia]|uniref:pentatricopeptide repeat-containing protein At2g13600-like n=1 Tax=Typha latifolia TaxID=4733 RepID=UPI003C2AD13E